MFHQTFISTPEPFFRLFALFMEQGEGLVDPTGPSFSLCSPRWRFKSIVQQEIGTVDEHGYSTPGAILDMNRITVIQSGQKRRGSQDFMTTLDSTDRLFLTSRRLGATTYGGVISIYFMIYPVPRMHEPRAAAYKSLRMWACIRIRTCSLRHIGYVAEE
ncbi:hypothetical protein EJ08DRAFT_90090 [Tothia fuscella]|uniref:Uncharacterized protein n=1 Tax=Tothia fuscella TaxID=1048955 RepID=A0A9P4NWU0_9PEZI|nr:hypothetical protein EJ08DRAFT_90090 [Tothia fuscella]